MKYRVKLFTFLSIFVVVFSFGSYSQEYIADYTVSKESVFRSIPVSAINAAKNNLHIMYCGTSHSSQTADGLRGLMQYKTGDSTLYAVTFNGIPVAGSLDIHYRPTSPVNVYSASDLSNDGVDGNGYTNYYHRTVDYLDHPDHADVNVVMWSWCSIEGHDVQVYLDNFAELISMYRAGGSKGRTAATEVKFVFMTGYARGSDGDTAEPPYIRSPYQNHKRIVDYCRANGYFCLDYWSQDTYHYETDAYKPTESGNDNIQHKAWFDTHVEGIDWFATRDYSSGAVKWPAHCSGTPQHVTSNRRAYAAWWIWARLAGWNGGTKSLTVTAPDGGENWPLDTAKDITWDSTGISGNVKISLWQNGSLVGTIAPVVSAAAESFRWQTGSIVGGTAPSGDGYIVKIKEKGTAVADTSGAPFTILPPSFITVTAPNGGETSGMGRQTVISWDCQSIIAPLKITLWRHGALVGVIAKNVNAVTGSFNWTTGSTIGGTAPPGEGYRIKIKEKGTAVADSSDADFTIVQPQISITSPNGGEDWEINSVRNITWNAVGIPGQVKITLWRNGAIVGIISPSADAASGSFSWPAGSYIGGTAAAGGGYRIKIKEKGTAVADTSDASFSLAH